MYLKKIFEWETISPRRQAGVGEENELPLQVVRKDK